MVGIDKRPSGIVPKIIAGSLLDGMSKENTGYCKKLQEIEVRDTFGGMCFHII